MYGYDPKQRGPEAGSWREVFAFIRAAMVVLLPIIAVLLGIMAALLGTLALAQVHAALAAIPVALLVAGIVLVIRRERRNAAREAERLAGPRP